MSRQAPDSLLESESDDGYKVDVIPPKESFSAGSGGQHDQLNHSSDPLGSDLLGSEASENESGEAKEAHSEGRASTRLSGDEDDLFDSPRTPMKQCIGAVSQAYMANVSAMVDDVNSDLYQSVRQCKNVLDRQGSVSSDEVFAVAQNLMDVVTRILEELDQSQVRKAEIEELRKREKDEWAQTEKKLEASTHLWKARYEKALEELDQAEKALFSTSPGKGSRSPNSKGSGEMVDQISTLKDQKEQLERQLQAVMNEKEDLNYELSSIMSRMDKERERDMETMNREVLRLLEEKNRLESECERSLKDLIDERSNSRNLRSQLDEISKTIDSLKSRDETLALKLMSIAPDPTEDSDTQTNGKSIEAAVEYVLDAWQKGFWGSREGRKDLVVLPPKKSRTTRLEHAEIQAEEELMETIKSQVASGMTHIHIHYHNHNHAHSHHHEHTHNHFYGSKAEKVAKTRPTVPQTVKDLQTELQKDLLSHKDLVTVGLSSKNGVRVAKNNARI